LKPPPAGRLRRAKPSSLAQHRITKLSYIKLPSTFVAHQEFWTPHDLRHFYAPGLIAAGCDVVTVQRALGHAKATTTLNTYAHLWPTAEDRTRQAAGGLFAAATAVSVTAQRRPRTLH
jgi:site-specific recombinase XerD